MRKELQAYLFPGQGSQSLGMGQELSRAFPIARDTFEEADEHLGFSLSKLAWEGPEIDLNDTINTQPALLVVSIAVMRVLEHIKPDLIPDYVAGHSMGQLSALVASKALSFSDALSLTRKRGEVMKQAGERSPGKMAAILGLDIDTVEALCLEASNNRESVHIANDNCPGQVVISGSEGAIERACNYAKKAGARKVRILNVSIPAHSPMMESAQLEFNEAINSAPFSDPKPPIISNIEATPIYYPPAIKRELSYQLTSRVRWTESISNMVDLGVSTFIELGSKSVLTGLLKRINNRVRGISIERPDDFDKLNLDV
jgi:[acyl-carrier-protein] S-malonyltransferase